MFPNEKLRFHVFLYLPSIVAVKMRSKNGTKLGFVSMCAMCMMTSASWAHFRFGHFLEPLKFSHSEGKNSQYIKAYTV
jgi:hypothetical protein